MSTPNPLAPQGSLLEKQGRGRSTFQIISFIGAIHVVALCGLLWIGCKKDDQSGLGSRTDPQGNSGLPPVGGDMGLPPTGLQPGGDPLASTNLGLPPVPATGVSTALPPVSGGPGTIAPPLPNVGSLPPLPPPSTGLNGLPPVDPGPGSAPTTAAGEYKVQKGDIGTSIAKKAGVSLAALKAANPSVDWSRLKINQVLAIPAATTAPAVGQAPTTGTTAVPTEGTSYQVRPGDTGSKIAKKTGVSWKAIRAANNLTSDNIRPGQKLTIPAKGSAAPTTSGARPGPVAPPAPDPSPSATPLPTFPGR
jgi:LysM repeat protein